MDAVADVGMGAAKGALAGAAAGAWGGPWGALIGGVIGAIAGGIGGGIEHEASNDLKASQDRVADANKKSVETQARNQAAAMFKAAAADPRATSATMFTKVELQRSAKNNYADIRDKGEPFTPVEKKQFYGKTTTTKAA